MKIRIPVWNRRTRFRVEMERDERAVVAEVEGLPAQRQNQRWEECTRPECSQTMVAEHIEGYGKIQLGVQGRFWTRTRELAL